MSHKPLVALFGSKHMGELPPRIFRFRLRLARFDYMITHVAGKYPTELIKYSSTHVPMSDMHVKANRANQVHPQFLQHAFFPSNSFNDTHVSRPQSNGIHSNHVILKITDLQHSLPLRLATTRGPLVTMGRSLEMRGSRVISRSLGNSIWRKAMGIVCSPWGVVGGMAPRVGSRSTGICLGRLLLRRVSWILA